MFSDAHHTLQDPLEEVRKEVEALGRKALVIHADITDEEAVKSAVQNTVSALGGLDVMVANAGIAIPDRLVDGKYRVCKFFDLI